jgi:hypothetical protein
LKKGLGIIGKGSRKSKSEKRRTKAGNMRLGSKMRWTHLSEKEIVDWLFIIA